ncbi:conserved hypothetical protein [Candidatus Methylobacter favarea]|uniref:Polyketide cyclase n=1 Tax=Candidatus Methylobacter favarea TaxID=2707345 RepID=A0A8S0XA19_9GAMM|nr:SRPBCC family protein [Candidatus Methylobacter favarea]CAA9892936.1 conserved hypothetical protein [Candidatus Methylobacter favarea]
MPKFHLTTFWLIPAPVKTVWSCLVDTETWPSWWKYVIAVEQMEEGDINGINNVRRYYWRTCLPYSLMLNLRVTQIQANRFINVEVTGDLQGEGICQLTSAGSTNQTQVEFKWRVYTCKPWMNWFASLTRPIFAWNHARVMKKGEQSLIQHLATMKNS